MGGATGEVVVEVHDLLRRFGTFTAVDHVSFNVRGARSSACSARTAPARPRPFACSAGCSPATGGDSARGGRRCAPCPGLGARTARLCRTEIFALRPADSDREPGVLRQRLWPARRAQARAHRLGAGAIRARARSRACPARSCRAASNSVSPWRRRCCTSRRFCSWMSPPAAPIPCARRAFWRRITALAEQGVTIIVTTHFMAGSGVLRPHRDHGFRPNLGRRARRRRSAHSRRPAATAGAEDGRCLHRRGRAGSRQR